MFRGLKKADKKRMSLNAERHLSTSDYHKAIGPGSEQTSLIILHTSCKVKDPLFEQKCRSIGVAGGWGW